MDSPLEVEEIEIERWMRIRACDQTELEGGGLRLEFRPEVDPGRARLASWAMGTDEFEKPKSERPSRPTWHLARFWIGAMIFGVLFVGFWGSLFAVMNIAVFWEASEEAVSLTALAVTLVVVAVTLVYRLVVDRVHPGINEHQIVEATADGLRFGRSATTGPLGGVFDKFGAGRGECSSDEIQQVDVETVDHPGMFSKYRTEALVIRGDGQRYEFGHGIEAGRLGGTARDLRRIWGL